MLSDPTVSALEREIAARNTQLSEIDALLADRRVALEELEARFALRNDELRDLLSKIEGLEGDPAEPIAVVAAFPLRPQRAPQATAVASEPAPAESEAPPPSGIRQVELLDGIAPPRARPALAALPGEAPLAEVHFESASARLSPGAELRAREAARVLAAVEVEKIRIFGHSDTVGSRRANLALSQSRAETVARILSEGGVPADKIEVVGLGNDAAGLPVLTPQGVPEPLNRSVGIYPVFLQTASLE